MIEGIEGTEEWMAEWRMLGRSVAWVSVGSISSWG